MTNAKLSKASKINLSTNSLIWMGMTIYCITPELQAISVDALKVPMQNLKTEVFSWLFAIKVAAAAVGGAFSLVQQSLTPFGVGAGIAAGIHFFDKYIGDGSAILIGG